ncbi:hypothetical protein [Crassaminicella profunda]|uniref:hypothetical protein n=1 Tax=Crassaminicella profunda TaxID=1286698 RepID=UPI001CA721A6|nr:hypothetical protein [Crassaminicella profunda]QZY54460.1 hypothetical protein K7H06_15655 [Crassaminicella profunda]
MNERKIRVNHKVALAILCIDDYSDEVVKGMNIKVEIKNLNKKPIIKKDGYFIFTNMEDAICTIVITGNIYMDEEKTIDLRAVNPLDPIVKIRLRPNRRYPLKRGMTCILGKIQKSSKGLIRTKVKIIPLHQRNKMRMVKDLEKKDGQEITLNNPQNADLTLKSFWINDSGKEELCTIKKEIENKTYEFYKPLKYKHEKGTELLRVYDTYTDEKGFFILCIKDHNENLNKAKIIIQDEDLLFEDEIEYLSSQVKDLGSIQVR